MYDGIGDRDKFENLEKRRAIFDYFDCLRLL